MTTTGLRFWATCLVTTMGFAFMGASASAETIYKVYSDGWVVPISPSVAAKMEPVPVSKNLTVNGITFNIAYEDVENSTGAGFDDPVEGAARRAAVERALTTVADTLNETGVLDVEIGESTSLGGNTLAIGGTFFSSAVGFSNGTAFIRIQSGVKPFGGFPEMFAQVDFSNNFYTGTDPNGIGFGQTDLETVMLHEFTHGIGLLSLSDSEGFSAIQDTQGDPLPGVFTVWDSLMLRGTGQGAFNLFVGPSAIVGETFQGTPADLVSQDLFFEGLAATDAFGSNPPIYAPASFSAGSSLSHWDTGNVPAGAVMEHIIFQGEISREYPDFEKGALFDLGWTNIDLNGTPPPPVPDPDATPFPPPPGGVPVGGNAALLGLIAVMLIAGTLVARRRIQPSRAK